VVEDARRRHDGELLEYLDPAAQARRMTRPPRTVVRRTPLYERHWQPRRWSTSPLEMPQLYSSVKAEQQRPDRSRHLRLTHMGRFESGPAPRSSSRPVNQRPLELEDVRRSTTSSREDGGWSTTCRLPASPASGQSRRLAAGRQRRQPRERPGWLREHAPAGVEVLDRSDETCLVALQDRGRSAASAEGRQGGHPLLRTARVGRRVEALLANGLHGRGRIELFVASTRRTALDGSWMPCDPCGLACRDVCRWSRLRSTAPTWTRDQSLRGRPGLTVKLQKGTSWPLDPGRVRAAGPRRRS